MTIGADILSAWYGAQVARSTISSAPVVSNTQTQQPSEPAPWEAGSGQEPNAELLRSVIADGEFFTSQFGEFADLEVSDDEKQLFAMYEGLRALTAIAEAIGNEDVQSWEMDLYTRRFDEGLSQLTTFFDDLDLEDVNVFQGEDVSKMQGTLEVPSEPTEYLTNTVYAGDFDDEVPAFTGSVSFDISVRKNNTDTVININLDDMGSTPRTMQNVEDHINAELEAAGMVTRFDATKLGEENEDGVIEGNNYGWKIKGTSTEQLTFSDASAGDALIVAGVSGDTETSAGQITKLTDLAVGATVEYSTRVEADPTVSTETNSLDEEVEKVVSNALTIEDIAYGADGSVYVVGRATVGVDNQELRGDGDLVVLKYDTAGQEVWTRTLGAVEDAEGSSIAVDSNGDVIVAGTVTGALGTTTDLGGSDAIAVKFSADGEEQWLQRFGSRLDETVNDISIGSDGTIYVAGSTQSSFGDNGYVGGTDAYIRAIDTDGNALYTRNVEATSGDESAMATSIDSDGGLLVASEVDGRAVLYKYAAGDDGTGSPVWSIDLGDLGSGWIGDIEVDASGDIFLAGAAESDYAPGTVVNANAGGRDAMLTKISVDAATDTPSVDYVTFLGGASDNSANDLVISGGTVYVAGRTSEPLDGSTTNDQRQSFIAAFDASTGAVGEIAQYGGRGGLSEANAITLASGADSALDLFGLPTGELHYADSRVITEQSSLREGDFFYIQVDENRKQKIEIEAGETMRSLAFKVDNALLLDGKGDVARASNGDALKITAEEGHTITVTSGSVGRDALAGLGLTEGAIRGEKPDGADHVSTFELELNQDLDISDEEKALETAEILRSAMSKVQLAYQSLFVDTSEVANNTTPTGPAPAYLTAQLANYQAGLDRLFQGSGTTVGLF